MERHIEERDKMTDKKLTDEDIIKNLKFCEDCSANININIIDLITRQKSEIERLKECPKCVYEYDGEVMEYCVQGPCSNFKTVEKIKAEAYKEFADKLEDKIIDTPFGINCTIDMVDNLLKEMVGEEK